MKRIVLCLCLYCVYIQYTGCPQKIGTKFGKNKNKTKQNQESSWYLIHVHAC